MLSYIVKRDKNNVFFKKNTKKFLFNSIIIIVIFTIIYWLCGNKSNFNLYSELSFIDALYFTLCTQSTVGYGDITPKSQSMRIIVSLHFIIFISNTICYL